LYKIKINRLGDDFTKGNKKEVNICSPNCNEKFYKILKNEIKTVKKDYDKIYVACIGTDRCTGDSLGPLVGYKLGGIKEELHKKGIEIVGNLENPLHAKRLEKFKTDENTLVIAIDASLGKIEKMGRICIKQGPIYPGTGLNKKISPIGDISITGVVNVCGKNEDYSYILLQNTRLFLVMDMADIIATGLKNILEEIILSDCSDCCEELIS